MSFDLKNAIKRWKALNHVKFTGKMVEGKYGRSQPIVALVDEPMGTWFVKKGHVGHWIERPHSLEVSFPAERWQK